MIWAVIESQHYFIVWENLLEAAIDCWLATIQENNLLSMYKAEF